MNGNRRVSRGILKNCMALAAVLVFMAPFAAFGKTCTNNNCKSDCDDGNTIFGPEGEGSGAPKAQIEGYIWKCSWNNGFFGLGSSGTWKQQLGICAGNPATTLEPGLIWSKQDGGSRARCWKSTAAPQQQQQSMKSTSSAADDEAERKKQQAKAAADALEAERTACLAKKNSVWSGNTCVDCGTDAKPNATQTSCDKFRSCKYITGGNLEKCATDSAYGSPEFNSCVDENKISLEDC